MTTESDIEHKLVTMVKRHGGYCLKWVSPGCSGVPDRIVLLPRRVIFVETKRPYGGRVSKLQQYWRDRIQRLGFDYYFVWNETDIRVLELTIK